VLLFSVISLHASSAMADVLGSTAWTQQYDSQKVKQVDIDFVRGQAEIIRQPGPITVSIQNISATDPDAVVWLDISDQGDQISLIDLYPRTHTWHHRECLPPIGPRGNFWYSKARLVVKVFAPSETRINITFMESAGR